MIIKGTVVSGSDRGKELGYPTANIHTEEKTPLPDSGVYFVSLAINKETLYGMMNIGVRPTFDENIQKIEVHIFDFNQSIYGETVEIQVQQKIREEQKFNGIEELKDQLAKDEQSCRAIMSEPH